MTTTYADHALSAFWLILAAAAWTLVLATVVYGLPFGYPAVMTVIAVAITKTAAYLRN